MAVTADSERSLSGWTGRVLVLALPIVVANLALPIVSLVDTWIAGHLPGPQFLGGIALAGVLFNFLYWGFGFLRMTTTGLVAQSVGAGDADAARLHLLRGLLIAAVAGILILIVQTPLITLALALLGGGDEVRQVAATYAHARIWSAPATLANLVILGVLLGQQRVLSALALQLLSYGTNLAVTLTLVYGLDFGVVGIGAGTASGEWTSCLAGLSLMWRSMRPKGPAGTGNLFEAAAFRRLLAANTDIFLRSFCVLLAFSFFARMGASQGDAILAANALLLNLLALLSYGLDGFAHAGEALVGSAIGARDRRSLGAIIRSIFLCGFLLAALAALGFWILGPQLLAVLTDQAAIRDEALLFLPYMVAMPVIAVWGYILDGVFIGATRTGELRNAMALSLALFVALAWFLTGSAGNHGLWWSFVAFMLMRATCLGFLLLRRPLIR